MSTARAATGSAASARDLGSPDLWERSLTRSRQRRRLDIIGRKSRRRRKSASLAVSAAMVAAPVLPQTTAAATADTGTPAPESVGPGSLPSHVVLRVGSTGPLVAAVQTRLNQLLPLAHLSVDGVYGPLTREAVWDYQHRNGLALTGARRCPDVVTAVPSPRAGAERIRRHGRVDPGSRRRPPTPPRPPRRV